MYADDLLLFFEAAPSGSQAILQALNLFGDLVGHLINVKKSELYFIPSTPRQVRKFLESTW